MNLHSVYTRYMKLSWPKYVSGLMKFCLLPCLIILINPWPANASTAPLPPTCTDSVNNTPDYDYVSNTWSCVPISSSDAQWELHMLQVQHDYGTYCQDHGMGGQTWVLPDGMGGGCYNKNCMSSEIWCSQPHVSWANYASAFQNLEPQAAQLQAENAAYQALQAAITNERNDMLNQNYASGTVIGGMLCTVAKWFTGNVGKGLATMTISALGLGIMLGKLSMKTTFFVCTGVATIFAAETIVNAMSVSKVGQTYSYYQCGTAYWPGSTDPGDTPGWYVP